MPKSHILNAHLLTQVNKMVAERMNNMQAQFGIPVAVPQPPDQPAPEPDQPAEAEGESASSQMSTHVRACIQMTVGSP